MSEEQSAFEYEFTAATGEQIGVVEYIGRDGKLSLSYHVLEDGQPTQPHPFNVVQEYTGLLSSEVVEQAINDQRSEGTGEG